MIVKKIKYVDFNGNEREDEFCFHLSKAEAIEMEVGVDGGYGERLKKIVNSKDPKSLINSFKKLVLDCYGVKSEDGKRFIKNDELREAFVQSPAYSEIFMELAVDAKAAAEFVNGVIPNMDFPKDQLPAKS